MPTAGLMRFQFRNIAGGMHLSQSLPALHAGFNLAAREWGDSATGPIVMTWDKIGQSGTCTTNTITGGKGDVTH